MGAAQSVDEVAERLPDVPNDAPSQVGGHAATILYKYLINRDTGQWNLASRNAKWRFYNNNEDSSTKTAWFLEIEAGDIDLFVAEAAELQVDLEHRTATFYDAETACVCKLKLPDRDACRAFSDAYFNKLYENLSSAGQSHLGNAGDWFFKPADAEPMDWDPTPDAPPVTGPQPATPQRWRDSEAFSDPRQEVQGMVMGAGDNSFLVQKGQVSVLRNDLGGVSSTGRDFALTPPTRRSAGIGAGAEAFTPGRTILAKQETEMNMLSPGNRSSVYQADLASGKVIRQWNAHRDGVDIPMADIATDTKDAQLDHRSTFFGLDSNRLCRWDQRTAGGVVEELNLEYKTGKDYARGTNFTCMATSGDGFIAVGSKDGRIRLYGSKQSMEDYEFKAALTSVPGLGLSITAIDVSYDGRYVVATTDKYLIVLQTFYKDAKGRDTNGFVSRMGSNTPPPKLLRLKAEDRVKVGPTAVLSKAKFTWITSNDMTERWIAASCGSFTVLWNFRHVKVAKPNAISSGAFTITEHYVMIDKKGEKVVENAFLHDKFATTPQAKSALLVATQHKLYNCQDEDSDFD